MKIYKYTARDSNGSKQEAVKNTACLNDLLNVLHSKGLTPISIKEVAMSKPERRIKLSGRKIKSSSLASFCWQLSTMLKGGIPITMAMDAIAHDCDNLQFQDVINKILERINKGKPFSESISEFPNVFNRLACSIILAGETGGNLPGALERLAQYYDNREKLTKKIQSAAAYPLFVMGFISLVVVFIMAFIVPRFRQIYKQFGGQLPGFTKSFLNFYDILHHNFLHITALFLFLIILLILACTKTHRGHYIFSKTKLAIPLLGNLFVQSFLITFCRTMSTLLATGVSIIEIFDILVSMTNNDIIKSAIERTKKYIIEGSHIYLSVAATDFFPSLIVKMMQIGEESGSLSAVLDKTADYYERKVDSAITTATSILEPVMIIAAGTIVLVIVLALYLPIFSMSKVTR